MKNFTLFILFFISVSLAVKAQVITEEEMHNLLNSQEIQVDNPIISNFLMVRQISDGNEVVAWQSNPAGMQNTLLVNQDGTGNKAYVEQNGSGLKTHLWQYSSSNEANLWSEGNNILTEVKQQGGVNNVINGYIENKGNVVRSASMLQEGNDNRIDFSLRGDGFGADALEQSMVINQLGNGHEVDAHMEPFSESLQIDQSPGVNGEGMKVNVSTSAFSFPMKR